MLTRRIGIGLLLDGLVLSALGCGTPGVVEVHRVPNSQIAASTTEHDADAGDMDDTDDAGAEGAASEAGECPSGWSCMDVAALGYEAVDAQGDPVKASCSMGGIIPCDDDDPGSSCEGLTDPICVHLMLGNQEIVSCGQRCAP